MTVIMKGIISPRASSILPSKVEDENICWTAVNGKSAEIKIKSLMITKRNHGFVPCL